MPWSPAPILSSSSSLSLPRASCERVDALRDVRGLLVQRDHAPRRGPGRSRTGVRRSRCCAARRARCSVKSSVAFVVISPAMTTRPVVTQRLAGHPGGRVLGQRGVQDRVRDLVGHLVRVTLGHRLGGEQVLVVGQLEHRLPSRSWRLASVGVLSGLPVNSARTAAVPCTIAAQLRTGDVRPSVPQATVRVDHQAGRPAALQRPADPGRDQLRRLDVVGSSRRSRRPRAERSQPNCLSNARSS